jgi:hypothetical protein
MKKSNTAKKNVKKNGAANRTVRVNRITCDVSLSGPLYGGLSLTIGLDLGDRRSRYCVLDQNGDVIEEDSVATTRDGLMRIPDGCRNAGTAGTRGPQAAGADPAPRRAGANGSGSDPAARGAGGAAHGAGQLRAGHGEIDGRTSAVVRDEGLGSGETGRLETQRGRRAAREAARHSHRPPQSADRDYDAQIEVMVKRCPQIAVLTPVYGVGDLISILG